MGKARGYKQVEVVGMSGFKYTNPGGFLMRDGMQYVIARRTPSFVDMSSSDARWSDVVLLSRRDRGSWSTPTRCCLLRIPREGSDTRTLVFFRMALLSR